MKSFEFVVPDSVEEAVGALAGSEGAMPIAGGQSLLLEMKTRQATPWRLVSLAEVAELGLVEKVGSGLRIGSTVTYRRLADGAAGPEPGPAALLARVTANVADRAVRAMGTLGGAVCQAEPAFDAPVLTTVLDARFELAGAAGRRHLSALEFFRGPRQTARRQDEVLSAVLVPLPDRQWLWGFAKQGMRAHDAALASVALGILRREDGVVERSRIVVGGAVGKPQRAVGAEYWCRGRSFAELEAGLGVKLEAEITPTVGGARFSPAYRRKLLPGLVRRALEDAVDAG